MRQVTRWAFLRLSLQGLGPEGEANSSTRGSRRGAMPGIGARADSVYP